MRDLVLLGCILALIVASFRRPYFAALGYVWIDFLQPQRLTYSFLSHFPVALIMALFAFAFYLFVDRKAAARLGVIQILIIVFALYATVNTFGWAIVYDHAHMKWSWVWKGLLFSAFLPFLLTNRRRIEATMLIMVLSTSAITISAGIKTLLGGGGYGGLSFLVNNNTGLYEGSTLATVSMAFIPLILWLYRHNSIVPKSRLTLLWFSGVILSMILVTIGAEARTGLVAGGVLAGLLWLLSKRKLLIGALFAITLVGSVPFLPETFKNRMATITTFDEDQSASTRLAVWAWTLDFVKEHPLGGGFGAFRLNELELELQRREGDADNMAVSTTTVKDRARAYHNSFFEVLGELGYPGAAIYVGILLLALHATWKLRTIRTGDAERDVWFRDLGTMMLISMLVYLTGSIFVSIAFQPPYYDLLAITIAATAIARRERIANKADDKVGPRRPSTGLGAPVSAKA